MKCNLKTDEIAIFDEIFDSKGFKHFVSYFNRLPFVFRQSQGWLKIWRISDGQILSSPESYYTKMPTNTPIDWIHNTVYHIAKNYLQDICGEEGKDWDEIVYTPYIYPEGTKISWHDDHGYSAACIFYCHEEWSPHWGGELMVAKTPPFDSVLDGVEPDDEVSRKYTNKLLNTYGYGTYISPVPNRMAFTKGSVWHGINRVDKSAGDHMRASVVAFFKKSDRPASGCLAGSCHSEDKGSVSPSSSSWSRDFF